MIGCVIGCKIGCDHSNNELLVRYSSHDLNNELLVRYSSHDLNSELLVPYSDVGLNSKPFHNQTHGHDRNTGLVRCLFLTVFKCLTSRVFRWLLYSGHKDLSGIQKSL